MPQPLGVPLILTPEEIYLRAAAAGLAPDPPLTVSEWADRYRMLSSRSSSEPNLWRTSRTPYLRDVMDALSPSTKWQRIVFLKASQIGGTECGLNWIGYIMHRCPGPCLIVQPTTEMAKRLSNQRINPMIEACPELRRKVKDKRSTSKAGGSNTMLQKEFPGGYMVMTGANSAVGLRSMSVRFLMLDEVDGYPLDVDGEGDPVNLAIARTRTFPQRKIFLASTPSLTGRSRIERYYGESDQRVYEVPCPHCDEMQPLEWVQLRWAKGRAHEARYHCRACSRQIEETMKTRMFAAGRWRATVDYDSTVIGFHLSSLYSPLGWFSWGEAAEQYEKAGKNPQDLQVFFNTVLGQSYAESGETPDNHRLYERREPYEIGVVPAFAGALTAGADVQRDRIEVEVVAWGPRRESWSIDYRVFMGDTGQPEVWKKLTAMLDEQWPHELGGKLQLIRMAVDSGYIPMTVYKWARQVNSSRVMVVHGTNTAAALLGQSKPIEVGPQGQRVRWGIHLWPINTSIAKEELYRNLRLDAPALEKGERYPDGFCHFPQYSLEYFEQLCSERIMTRMKNGYAVPYWQQTRERNEALDCRVYARAAAAAARIDLWQDERWERVLDDLITRPVDEQPTYTGIAQQGVGLSPMPKFKAHKVDDPYFD